jgi:hypothetical protein
MIRATCPFCGKENLVGFFPEERPVRCEHFVFQGYAKHLGEEYVRKEFDLEARASCTTATAAERQFDIALYCLD